MRILFLTQEQELNGFYGGNMKEIVFLTGSMGRGGAERVISLLANFYSNVGWRVSIVMLLHDKVEYALEPSVSIVNLSNDCIRAAFDVPRLIWKTRQYLNSKQPDVVVSFMAEICLITWIACRGINARLVLSERIDPAAVKRNVLLKKALDYIYSHCSVTVLQTNRARDYFPQKVRDNSMIIPNPIRVTAKAFDVRKHRIVTAGRLTRQKNHFMLIEAFALIAEWHPEYSLDIYGEGPEREELMKQISLLGLTERIALKGNVPDIHEQIADAELFVLPSNYEGLSNALLEAMMMGLPCIATNCSGCDEVIKNDINGILIDIGDTYALRDALLYFIDNKKHAKELGMAAAASTFRFEIDNVIHMWRNAIEG